MVRVIYASASSGHHGSRSPPGTQRSLQSARCSAVDSAATNRLDHDGDCTIGPQRTGSPETTAMDREKDDPFFFVASCLRGY
jgi:hypothetical protein